MNSIESILKKLDAAISSLESENFDVNEVAQTFQKTCHFLASLLEQDKKERKHLEDDLNDLEEAVNALVEQNDILSVDIQVILKFLKENNINLSYIVTKSDIAQKMKGNKPQ